MRTERQTDIKKLTVVFRNTAKAPKILNKLVYSALTQHQYRVLATCFGFTKPSSRQYLLHGGTFSVYKHYWIT